MSVLTTLEVFPGSLMFKMPMWQMICSESRVPMIFLKRPRVVSFIANMAIITIFMVLSTLVAVKTIFAVAWLFGICLGILIKILTLSTLRVSPVALAVKREGSEKLIDSKSWSSPCDTANAFVKFNWISTFFSLRS